MTPLELEQCVLLASDVSSASSKQQLEATRMLHAWSVDAETLVTLVQTTQHESVVFFCLTSFPRSSITTNTTNATLQQQQTRLWQFLLSNKFYSFTSASHVRTKAAVVLAYLIKTAFPTTTTTTALVTAFDELCRNAPPDLYFKTLIALMEDSDFHTPACGIKDVMRGHYEENGMTTTTTTTANGGGKTLIVQQPHDATIVTHLVDTLLSHVAQYNTDETVLTLALTVLTHFASWVDVGLLLQDPIVTLVFASLSFVPPGVAAMQFVQELVLRGMDDDRKLALLQELDLMQKLHLSVNLETVDASPIEVVIEVAKLIDTTGQELAPMMESSNNNAILQKLWPQVMELFFRCFAYDDIDVSGAVLPLARRLTTMKDMPSLQLITIMYRQMKYPDDYQFDYEDDDEAEEEVYRSELRKLYQRLVRACPELCLQFQREALASLPVPLSTCPTSDIEAALRLVYHYCEGIRPPPGLQVAMQDELFCSLLTALHQSDISNHAHREVLLLYYNVSVRYYQIFLKHPELLPGVLEGLSGDRGLQHAHPHVRSRSCYLLLKLVKSVVKVMRPYVETAVTGIQGLLTQTNGHQMLRPDDALYLFETMGLLLGKTKLASTDQQRWVAAVVSPHIQFMEETLRSENLSRDPDSFGDTLARPVAAIAYLSKGFSRPPVEVQEVLAQTMSVTLSVLGALPANDSVRGKVFVFLQRMIQCINEQVLLTMPRFLPLLIEHCTADDIQDVTQLINQLCIKFRAEAIPSIDPSLLPFLHKCHQLVTSAGEVVTTSDIPPHLESEQLSVKKLSYVVLQHIVTYRLSPVLLSATNVSSLELVLRTMSGGATLVDDAVINKSCIVFFRELVDQWVDDANSHSVVGSGFLLFVLEVFVPGMIQSFLRPTFNQEDALQARNLNEFANIVFLLKMRIDPGTFDQYVTRGAFAGFPPQAIDAIRQVSTQREMELCLKEAVIVLKQRQQHSSS